MIQVRAVFPEQKPQEIQGVLRETLRRMRKARGFTQEQLASRIACSRSQIANIEAGHSGITLDTLRDIAIALDLTVRVSLVPKEHFEDPTHE